MHVLLVENDPQVASLVARRLSKAGYVVDRAPNPDVAMTLVHATAYGVILLDLDRATTDGFQVLRQLRAAGRNIPIILLTERDAIEDVVRGLDSGADDYVCKPFHWDDLLARIRALVRRSAVERLAVLRYGPLTLDRLKRIATVGDTRLELTPREFRLLELFLLNPEQVVDRTRLLEEVCDTHVDGGSNVVDVHIAHVRRKLAAVGQELLIQTVRGVGFALKMNRR